MNFSAFWWPVINILKVIYKGKIVCYNPIAKVVLRYMTGRYCTLFNSLLVVKRVSHFMFLTGSIAPYENQIS